MVLLNEYMPPIDIGVEFLQTKANWKTLSLNVCIVKFYVSKGFTGESYWLATLQEGSAYPKLTSICLYYKRFGPVIVSQSHLEEDLRDPGF